MTTARGNLLWPLLVVALGAAWLLVALDAVPEAVGDVLTRAWPALLVLLGLELLIGRRRITLAGRALPLNLLTLLVMLIALGGIVALAYREQGDSLRTDNVQVFDQALDATLSRVEVIAALQRTAVTAGPSEQDARSLAATYRGSRGHTITMAWDAQAGAGTLAIDETAGEAIPRLEDYGRATLALALPEKTVIGLLRLDSKAGDGALDLQTLQIERLEVTLKDGTLTVTLPAGEVLSGRLRVEGGDLELRVPPQVALTITLAEGSGEPAYDYNDLRYDLLRDGTLKLENTDEFQVGLTVWLDSGATLRVIDLE